MPDLDSVLSDPTNSLRALLEKAKKRGPVYDPENGPTEKDYLPEKGIWSQLNIAISKKGNETVRKTKRNLHIILSKDSRWKGRLWMNSFRNRLMYEKRDYSDNDDNRLVMWVERVYGVEYPSNTICEIAHLVGEENEYNPLVAWLEGLEWDGVGRMNDWLVRATGCEDTNINRRMGRAWLVQAVARAIRPGCKADCCLILVGPQGAKKSTVFRSLASDEYFSDTPIDIGNKDAYMQIADSWIYEVAELDSMKRASSSTTKAFISAQYDIFRPPFGRQTIRLGRHVCFCGSTNEKTFLFDPTGSRRFWPVEVGHIDINWVVKNRTALWAEAAHAYANGEPWWLEQAFEKDLVAASAAFQKDDPWSEVIEDWLSFKGGANLQTKDILRDGLKLDPNQMTRQAEMRVGDIMRKQGWDRKKRRVLGRPKWVWVANAEVIELPTGDQQQTVGGQNE